MDESPTNNNNNIHNNMKSSKFPHHKIMKKFISDLHWRFLFFLIVPSIFLLLFFSLSSTSVNPFSTLYQIRYVFACNPNSTTTSPTTTTLHHHIPKLHIAKNLTDSRIALCLVGGARRFELTGPSIIQNIINIYPNADLFLHSPLDNNAFKLSLLKTASRLASIKIFAPLPMPETESQLRVLAAANSPMGIQGLLQYFNLVEGCLTLINNHQKQNNFTYDWIIRTRVDGYWNNPLELHNFIPGHYVVPPGSSYGGLNDRFGVGDYTTSVIALSRLSLIPTLEKAGFRLLNSETSFKKQLTTLGIPFVTKPLPFCIVTDRSYAFPPGRFGVPVAALSSPGPLSGTKCRPCSVVCEGSCVDTIMSELDRGWSWTEWRNGTLRLCDAHGKWENGWENIFDGVVGERLAAERKRVNTISLNDCVRDFDDMKSRSFNWNAPNAEEICKLGLETRSS